MTSPVQDDKTETEEETVQKKRARRVSFAETTAVHFFKRDDECETTPDTEKDDDHDLKLRRSDSDEIMELLHSSSSSSSSSGEDDEDDDGVDSVIKSSFFRPLQSPSSATSIDGSGNFSEDNFFGPVSAEFIRPGRLSDSDLSDVNHELTMDSTAFSMNFRSLARSESGGEFKTPTGHRVPYGERTADPISTASSHGDSMVLTRSRMRDPISSLPVGTVNDSGNSDDMSLVGENHRRYDYGQLPPELDVLLGEGYKDMEIGSLFGDIERSNTVRAMDSENGYAVRGLDVLDLVDNRNTDSLHTTVLPETSGEAISAYLMNAGKGSDDVADAALGETARSHSNDMDDDPGPITISNNHDQATLLQINDNPYEKDKEGRIDSEVGGIFESPSSTTQAQELPIAGSISSLLPKRRKIFIESAALPYAQSNSAKGDQEFFVKGPINRGWSTSVFAKSVSRLKRLEVSFLSASKVEGNALESRIPVHSLRSMESDNHIDNSSKCSPFARIDAPVACLDVRFAESDAKARSETESDDHSLRNTGEVKHGSHLTVDNDEKFTGLHRSSPSSKTSGERATNSSSTASLETGFITGKSNDIRESELELHGIKTPPSMKSNSPLQDISFNDLSGSSGPRMLGDFACSPGSGRVNKVSASPLYEGSPFMLNLSDPGQKDADDLASAVNSHNSFLVEKTDKLKLSSCGTNHVEGVLQEGPMLMNQFSKPDISSCIETALKDNVSKILNVVSSNDNVETGRTLRSSTRGLKVQKKQSSPGSTRSSDGGPKNSPFQVLEDPKVNQISRRSPKATRNLRDHAVVNISDGQDDATPKLMSTYTEDVQLLQKSSDICSCNSPSSRKRKLVFGETKDHHNLAVSAYHNPNLCQGQKDGELKVSHCSESDSALRDWADVFSSFCGATKQLLSPLSDTFDLAMIAKLDDTLDHLQKLKSYELHEKPLDSTSFLSSERVFNTKLLLYKTVCQKAKLQLMRLKRDKLSDKARRIMSGVDDSEKLMSNCHHICGQSKGDKIAGAQLDCRSAESKNINLVTDKISALRKKFEDTDGEIRKLNKSFYSHIKGTKQLNSIESAASVKGLLQKMVACQLKQSKLQVCKIESLHAMHGQPNILFDHGGFMLQSFNPENTVPPGLLLTNRLNNEKIAKTFINDMDAYTAFSFVLSGSTHLKYESLKTVAEQTQKTVSLLHTLLDVVEEVQLAMIELRSLTWARFCQPSAGKLDLQLSFTDFKSGARMTLNIDITCLNRGVYPSQVLPYDVQGITARNHDKFESLLGDIRAAVRGVRCGFMRIINICRSVSKLVQDFKLIE